MTSHLRLATTAGHAAGSDEAGPVDLKGAMRSVFGAVSVVTAGLGAERTGATVTTAHSLSVEPETMLVSINLGSSTWGAIERFGHFCVNVLEANQVDVANRFAGRGGLKGSDRYLGSEWTSLVTGAGVLTGALASIDCEVEEVVQRHSHALVLGRVKAAVARRDGPALTYRSGRYAVSD